MNKLIKPIIISLLTFWFPFILVDIFDLKWTGEWYSLPFFMTTIFIVFGAYIYIAVKIINVITKKTE